MNLLDPLSVHHDPRLYVALATGERALAGIGASLRAGRSPVLLTGPSGIGKTLLLRVLAEREWTSFQRVRFSALLSVEPEEVADCLLDLLFGKRSPDAREAEIALLMNVRSPHDKPTLLLVDNIHRTPLASVRKLAALASAGAPALAIAVTGTNGPSLSALSAALAPEVTISLPESLPEPEIDELYESLLAHPGLSPRLRDRLASVPRTDVTRSAAGLPRLLKSEMARRNQDRWVPTRTARPEESPRLAIVRAPAAPVTRPATQTKPERAPRPRTRRIAAAHRAARSAARHLARPVIGIGGIAGALRALLFDTRAGLTRAARTLRAGACSAGVRVHRASTLLLRSARDVLGDSASPLKHSMLAAGRSTRASLVSGHANLSRVNREISAAARSAGAAVRSSGDALGEFASRLRDFALSAGRSARASLVSGYANVTRVPREIGAAARSAGAAIRPVRDALGGYASLLVESVLAASRSATASLVSGYANVTRVPREIGAAARSSGAAFHRAAMLSLRLATETARRAQVAAAALRGEIIVQLTPTDVFRSAREAAGRARRRLAGAAARAHLAAAALLTDSLEYGTRARGEVHTMFGEAMKRSSAALARAERAGLRAGPLAALPAAALLAVALLSLGQYDTEGYRALVASASEHLAALTPDASVPAPLARTTSDTRASPPPVNVQVNARPWARVHINGIAVGPTPLTRPLAPGVYQLEAEFPDGKRIQRKIDVGPEHRFVTLP